MAARLLLADDSVTIQRVIELTFADEDIAVTAVGDGEAAIAALDADPPDVVLADIGMPGRNGYEVAEHVRRSPALSHIPVLLLTGASEPADEARVRALGCAGVLVKPFEPQMVIARVRDVLAGRVDGGAPSRVSPHAPERTAPRPAPGGAPAGEASRSASEVDAYFEQLDAAFAKLATGPAFAVPAREAAPAVPPTPAAASVPGSAVTMASAFEALLGAEQGEPLPAPFVQAAAERRRQEERAAHLAVDVAERVVREIAPEIVSRIAERLVREEIERLKARTSEP